MSRYYKGTKSEYDAFMVFDRRDGSTLEDNLYSTRVEDFNDNSSHTQQFSRINILAARLCLKIIKAYHAGDSRYQKDLELLRCWRVNSSTNIGQRKSKTMAFSGDLEGCEVEDRSKR